MRQGGRKVIWIVPSGYTPRRHGGERYRIHHAELGAGDVDEVSHVAVVVPRIAIEQGIASGVGVDLIDQAIRTAIARQELGPPSAKELSERLWTRSAGQS